MTIGSDKNPIDSLATLSMTIPAIMLKQALNAIEQARDSIIEKIEAPQKSLGGKKNERQISRSKRGDGETKKLQGPARASDRGR